jgi:hypothetical protein
MDLALDALVAATALGTSEGETSGVVVASDIAPPVEDMLGRRLPRPLAK